MTYSPKQLSETVDQIERHLNNPHPLDATTAVKIFGEMGHVLIRSGLAGCEGELAVSRDSLARLGQVLTEISLRQNPTEESRGVSPGKALR